MMPDSKPETPITVALFVTCLTDQFYPRVGVAVTKILERFGCRVEFPGDQTCCGQPFFNNGFEAEARDLARRWVKIFQPFDYVVTPSASCCAMVRLHFPELLAADAEHGGAVARVMARTFEFAEFLDEILHVDFSTLSLPTERKLAYHPTCHQRGLSAGDACGNLLGRVGNVRLTPLDRAEQCCGFGGTFAVKYPDISGAIVKDKASCIAASRAGTLVCNDAGCSMNIGGTCQRNGVAVQVVHVAELLAEAMGIDADRW